MKHHFLVAVDSEKTSTKSIGYVADVCAGLTDEGSTIVVFHVLPSYPQYDFTGEINAKLVADAIDWFDTQTCKAGTELLAKMKDLLVKKGVKPERVITATAPNRGTVAPQILQAAADHQCDTIVVGRRGNSMVTGFMLGSVIEHLLRNPVGLAVWVIE